MKKYNYSDDVSLAYLLKKVKTDVLSVLNAAVEKIYIALGNKVEKSGDTMSGNLEIENTSPGTILKNTAMDVTNSSYTQNNSYGFRLRDKNDKNVAIVTDRYLTNGTTGLWMTGWKTVNGTAINNTLGLYVDKDGNRVVDLYPSEWRAALNVVDKSGDTMTGHLTLAAGNEMRVRAGFKSNGTYSSNQYALQYRLDDSEGTCIGLLRSVHYSGGNEALDLLLWRKVNGADVYNTLQLAITPNGGRVVTVTDPAIWRAAFQLGTNGAFPITVAQGGSGQTGITTTTTASSIITAGSGITILGCKYAQWGKIGQVYLRWKSSSEIRVFADGNVTNVTVGTLVAGKRPAIASVGVSMGDAGGPAFFYLADDGTVTLAACGGTGATRTIAAGTEFYCMSTYILP